MSNDDQENFWKKVRRWAGRMPFVLDALAMYAAMLDPLTPIAAKATIAAALAYFVLPWDAVPEALVGPFGFSDDAAVIAGALAVVRSYVSSEHYAQARAWMD